MPKRKENERFALKGEKDCWHSYSLQMLQPGQFADVVGRILSGHYSLIVSRLNKRIAPKVN